MILQMYITLTSWEEKNMTTDKGNEITIDEKKLNHMKLNILKVERDNLKTRDKTNDEMVETIRKIITDEVKKIY